MKEIVSDLKGPKQLVGKRGFAVPLNIFLFQEIMRFQAVLAIVRKYLNDTILAINGQVIMTPDLVDTIDAIFDLRVPGKWTHDNTGAEISWLSSALGSWFSQLSDRYTQLN